MSLLLALAGLLAFPSADTRRVDDFACFDHTGKFQRLSRHSDARFVVLYVFMDDCPIVRQNASELTKLAAEFEPRGVRFLGFDPAPQDGRAKVQEECAKLGLDLPILLDERQCASEMLGVTRSGEALVIATKDRQLLWRGPLDDRLEYGAQRAAASRSFLREALDGQVKGYDYILITPVLNSAISGLFAAISKPAIKFLRVSRGSRMPSIIEIAP